MFAKVDSCIEQAQEFAARHELVFVENTDNCKPNKYKIFEDGRVTFATTGVLVTQAQGKFSVATKIG